MAFDHLPKCPFCGERHGRDPKQCSALKSSGGGLHIKNRQSSKEPVGDGVAFKSVASPAGLTEKMAEAIQSGKLNLKRGRPKLEEKRAASDKPWIKAGMSRASWYRRQK